MGGICVSRLPRRRSALRRDARARDYAARRRRCPRARRGPRSPAPVAGSSTGFTARRPFGRDRRKRWTAVVLGAAPPGAAAGFSRRRRLHALAGVAPGVVVGVERRALR